MKKLIFSLLATISFNAYALTPADVQSLVQQAKDSVQSLPQTQEEDIAITIAVSLSMPKASLLKLGQDARAAGLALTFRGVGKEVPQDPSAKPKSVVERYGKGLIARHLEDFKFLTDIGASVQIDPVLFARHGITDVPRVRVVPVCRTACEQKQALLVARGDVSLRYALESLFKDASEKLKAKPERQDLQKALKLIQEALSRLGERP